MAVNPRQHNDFFPQLIADNSTDEADVQMIPTPGLATESSSWSGSNNKISQLRTTVKIVAAFRRLIESRDEAERLKNSAQMVRVTPSAATSVNPWLGMSHQFIGMNHLVIQPQIIPMNIAENGLANNLPYGTRKRSRATIENQYIYSNLNVPQNASAGVPVHGFANQSEPDFIISQLYLEKKIKMEIEARRYGEVLCWFQCAKQEFMQKYQEQAAQILKLEKQNMALEKRVKSLYTEANQWKEVAKTSQAENGKTLHRQLSNAMAQVRSQDLIRNPWALAANYKVEESLRVSSSAGADAAQTSKAGGEANRRRIMCRVCGKNISCVLLLPCMHLCLCTFCSGTLVQIRQCPVCDITVSLPAVHVNLP